MKHTRLVMLLAVLSQLVVVSARAGQIPTPINTTAPSVSTELATRPGEVELLITLNGHGYVIGAEVKRSTNPELNRPSLVAIRQWRYTAPAVAGTTFVQSFRFGGDTIDTTPIAATRPEPRNQVAPQLPEELTHVSGEVTVAVAIDANGTTSHASIVRSSHEELNAPCLAAVKQWTFKPATENGQAIASNVYIPFHFIGKPGAVSAETAKAELVDNDKLVPLRQPNPIVPEHLASLNGDVSLALTVDAHGYVVAAAVQSATNPELGELARNAVLQWKFRPVVRNGVAITVKAIQPIQFGEGYVSITPVDKLASVRHSVSPILPEELKGVSGFARVVFDIDADGRVVSATVTDSSHEAFKSAILAVARDWTFNPSLRAGVPTPARVSVPFVFGPKFASN